MTNEIMKQEQGTVASKPVTFSEALTESLNNINEALPVGFNKARFVQEAVSLLNENKVLSDFARSHGTGQIKLGLVKAATLGLSFQNKEAYLIPYGSQLNFMLDYRGTKKLAKKYSPRKIKEIYAKVVRQGDEISFDIMNGEQVVNFKPIPFSDADMIGAFAVCQYEDGGVITEMMSKAEIEKVRSKSKSGRSGPWVEFPQEMWKKTVLRRLTKGIELDFDSIYAQAAYGEEDNFETEREEPVDVFDEPKDIVDIMEEESGVDDSTE